MVLVLALSELRSQEVIPVTGGDVSGSGGPVSWPPGSYGSWWSVSSDD